MSKNKKPLVIIISGPSGVGKDAILAEMKNAGKPYFFAVTATTRSKRPGEIDGVDYLFVEKEKFKRLIESNGLLEWATVYGNFYGVPREPIEIALSEGRDVIVKVDVQGASAIKSNMPQAISIFIAPPSIPELKSRLMGRKTESKDDLELRLKTAQREMETQSSFDHVVVSRNNEIHRAIAEIETIVQREKSLNPLSRYFRQQYKKGSLAWQLNDIELLKPMHLGDQVLRIRRKTAKRVRIRRLIRRLFIKLRRFKRKFRKQVTIPTYMDDSASLMGKESESKTGIPGLVRWIFSKFK